MSLATTIKSHWIAVLAGVIPHAIAPTQVTIDQDGVEHTLRAIALRKRTLPQTDGTFDTVESVRLMILRDPDAHHDLTDTPVGGLPFLKMGSQLNLHGKKYVHTGEITDDSDAYTVSVWERRFRSVQGKGVR
jgi:hypothetical protein